MKHKLLNVFFVFFVSFSVSQNSFAYDFDPDYPMTCAFRELYDNYLEPIPTQTRLLVILTPYVLLGLAPGMHPFTRIITLTVASMGGVIGWNVMAHPPRELTNGVLMCGPFSSVEERQSYIATSLVLFLPPYTFGVLQGMSYFLTPVTMERPVPIVPANVPSSSSAAPKNPNKP